LKKSNLLLIIVDVSASTGAFVGMVCLIAVHHSVSGRTGCRRCGRVGKTPRLCSSTGLAPHIYSHIYDILFAPKLSGEQQLDRPFRRRLQSKPKCQQ